MHYLKTHSALRKHEDTGTTSPFSVVLTPREVHVLDLLSHSLQNKGNSLNISTPLVKKIIRTVFRKLNVHTRTEAALLWINRTSDQNLPNPEPVSKDTLVQAKMDAHSRNVSKTLLTQPRR